MRCRWCFFVPAISGLSIVLSGPTRSALQAMLANLGSDDELPSFPPESSDPPSSGDVDEADTGMPLYSCCCARYFCAFIQKRQLQLGCRLGFVCMKQPSRAAAAVDIRGTCVYKWC